MTTSHEAKSLKLVELLELLKTPRTRQQLDDLLGAKSRTTQDYLKALINQEKIELEPNIYPPRYRLKTQQTYYLGENEAIAMVAAARLLYHHAPSFNTEYKSVLEKLLQKLPNHIKTAVLQSTERQATAHRSSTPLVKVLEAWRNKQVLRFHYLRPNSQSGKPKANEVEVYFVEISRNLETYLIGYERTYYKKIVTFKITSERMKDPQVTSDTYEMPPTFNPQHYFSSAWGVIGTSGGGTIQVVLHFHDKAAQQRIREGGYPNLTYKKLENGVMEVCIKVGTDNTGFALEILPWIQSFSSKVEVISPPALKKRWLLEARELLQKYDEELDA